jgi:FxLD family lantipeptide
VIEMDNVPHATALNDKEFTLDVRVVEAVQPVGSLLLSTSDNCGSTCSGSACNSSTSYPD